MCHEIACARCGKPTWEGCGEHIEYALKGVPLDQRCTCPRSKLSDLKVQTTNGRPA